MCDAACGGGWNGGQQGHVSGEEGSAVTGTVIDGVLNLRIELEHDTYRLERHYTHDEHTHMMYKESDVKLGRTHIHPRNRHAIIRTEWSRINSVCGDVVHVTAICGVLYIHNSYVVYDKQCIVCEKMERQWIV